MCGPAAIALVAASSALSAYQTKEEVKANNKAAEYNAQIAEHNAAVADEEAKQAQQAGDRQLKTLRIQGEQMKGAQKSALAASGVDVNTGSALTTLQDTARNVEYDALTTKYNTAVNVWQARNKSNEYSMQAQLSRMNKRNADKAVLLSGLTSGVGSGASVYAASKSK